MNSTTVRGACLSLIIGVLSATHPAGATPPVPPTQDAAAGSAASRAPQRPAEDWVLANKQIRVRLRPDNLTVSVDDLGTQETWGSDPWENSAGRIHLQGKHGETVTVSLGAAAQKRIEAIPAGNAEDGVQISLAEFRSRMGPVRNDRDPGAHLSLVLQILLAKDSPDLVFRVQQLQNRSQYWGVDTIEWPLRLFPVRTVQDDGYVVIAEQQGMLIPSRFDKAGYFRYLNWIWERIAGQAAIFNQSTMPWFGGKKGESSFLCIIETSDDVAYGVIANDVRSPEQPPAPPSAIPGATTALNAPRLSAIWPYWRSVKGELGYPRVAHYIFQPHGGYVEMCKTYRRYAEKTGKLVTLKQKIAANPEVEKLIGAPNFEIQVVANRPREPQYQGLSGAVYDGYHRLLTTFEQVEAIVRDLKDDLGVERAVIRIAGWGKKGYDNERPVDQAEVNIEAGGPEKLAAAIGAAKTAGYLGGLWDNYRNFDLNSPSYHEKYIIRDATGAMSAGFSSEGGFSQEICPMEAVKLFQRNMDNYQRVLKPNLIYLDTIGGLPLIECYDPRHPLTRSETRAQRLDIMQVATNAGVVLGAEGPPQDWNLKLASFYDEAPISFGIDVPLWDMVYHDCALLYRQHASPYNYGMDNYGYSRGPWPAKFLRGLLYGHQSSWTVSNQMYWSWRTIFKSINDVLAPHERRLAFDQLMSHRFLTPDLLVQQTVFSSGVQVTVNYGEFPFKMEDGTELLPYGFRITDKAPGGHSFAGRVATAIVPGSSN